MPPLYPHNPLLLFPVSLQVTSAHKPVLDALGCLNTSETSLSPGVHSVVTGSCNEGEVMELASKAKLLYDDGTLNWSEVHHILDKGAYSFPPSSLPPSLPLCKDSA